MQSEYLRLGVNIDHVATIRNARGGGHPDPVRAARLAAQAGADGITAHLREDRRHIADEDIDRLMADIDLPLNLEMAATDEMLDIALRHKPHACCLVPEKREELTTEGGLDAAAAARHLEQVLPPLHEAGVESSIFVDPLPEPIEACARAGARFVELHTGRYANARGAAREAELQRLETAARYAHELGLRVNAGHGLDYDNVQPVASLPFVEELNIGHAIVSRAVLVGLDSAVREMQDRILAAEQAEA